ncbi:MAG: isoaspartyl peptidase/L-asparaginase [Chakrabartia sp.]
MTIAAVSPPEKPKWALVIHGGAGSMTRDKLTPEQDADIRAALATALSAGSKVLEDGGSSLDAVEAAVRVLEDDPHFNAGKGAVLTYDGTISLDAAIMDGRTRAAGAIAGTSSARNPVSAARRVMEDSPHVMLSGAGADSFVAEKGLATESQDYFETPERRRQLDELKAKKVGWYDVDLKYGTVGAVALDMQGHVAATYADDRACAVSATGAGEFFIRVGVAQEICARVRMTGERIVPAASAVMAEVKELGGTGGVIVIAPDGQIGWSFNTPGMYRGGRDSTGRERIAIYGDE